MELGSGVVHAEGLQTALAARLLADGPPAYAGGISVVTRRDAATSTERAYYLHGSPRSAGSPIVAVSREIAAPVHQLEQ